MIAIFAYLMRICPRLGWWTVGVADPTHRRSGVGKIARSAFGKTDEKDLVKAHIASGWAHPYSCSQMPETGSLAVWRRSNSLRALVIAIR